MSNKQLEWPNLRKPSISSRFLSQDASCVEYETETANRTVAQLNQKVFILKTFHTTSLYITDAVSQLCFEFAVPPLGIFSTLVHVYSSIHPQKFSLNSDSCFFLATLLSHIQLACTYTVYFCSLRALYIISDFKYQYIYILNV